MTTTTIWKFDLDAANDTVMMPAGAGIIHVGTQRRNINNNGITNVVCIWAEVDPNAPLVEHNFIVMGTGAAIIDGYQYIGTTSIGPLVWHVFEVLTPGAER